MSNVYQYDLLGRITNVLANGSSVANYGFDVVGNLQSLSYANGVTNLYQYDSMNRLTNQVWNSGSTVLASFGYTLGATGNRTALTESINGTSRTYNWAYDYLYRLTGETIGNMGMVNYNFDAVGNRTNRISSVSGIANQSPTFTANDWLTSDTYDTNGNTTVSGSNNYQYDALNHLTNANGGAILIAYDGDGNRASKKVGSTTTYYLVDDRNPSGYAQVLEEYQGSTLSRVYNYGLALVSQRQASGGTVSYFGSDGHGSTRFLLNTSGAITDTYAYDAYGTLIASSGTTPNNYLYCCQQWDDNLGLYYNRARYLNPDTGRFWTMDTFAGNNEDPLSLHKYLYCQGDPVMGTDLSGLNTVLVVRDPDVPAYASGAGADSAASHFQKAGWTVVRLDSTGFINYNQQYDGIVTSGHGDDQLSASLTVGIIKASLTQTHSRLEVGIFLSCHSTAFARPLLSPQCSTGNALFITYSGYGASIATRRWRVGKMIDAWVANPKQTEYDLYNPADDLIGTISYGIVRPAAIAAWNALGNILDEMPDLSGIMD